MIATDARARDLLIQTGTPPEAATAIIELISVGRDRAVAAMEDIAAKVEATATQMIALADERDALAARVRVQDAKLAAVPLSSIALQSTVDRLTAELAAVTAERDQHADRNLELQLQVSGLEERLEEMAVARSNAEALVAKLGGAP